MKLIALYNLFSSQASLQGKSKSIDVIPDLIGNLQDLHFRKDDNVASIPQEDDDVASIPRIDRCDIYKIVVDD